MLANEERAAVRMELRGDSGSENELRFTENRVHVNRKESEGERNVSHSVGVFELKFVAFMIGYPPHTSCHKRWDNATDVTLYLFSHAATIENKQEKNVWKLKKFQMG